MSSCEDASTSKMRAASQKKMVPDVSLAKCLQHLQSKRPSVQHVALSNIRTKYIKDNEACRSILSRGLLPKLLHLISDADLTSKVLDLALSVLGNLATVNEGRSQMISENAVELIGGILMRSEDASIQNRACRTLTNLAHDTQCSCAIHSKAGLLTRIVLLLKATESKENAQTLVRSLRVLANNRVHLLLVLKTSCVSGILKMLTSSSSSTVMAALNCLSHLCSIYHGDRQLQKECNTKHDSRWEEDRKETDETEKEKEKTNLTRKLDEAADVLSKPNVTSLPLCCDELTRQLMYCEVGLQALIEKAQNKNSAQERLARSLLYTLIKQAPLRTQLSNAGLVQYLTNSVRENKLKADTDTMRLMNALAVCSQEAGCRAKIRDNGGLELILEILDSDEWLKMHCRLISALVCYIYDDQGLEALLALRLCERLMKHLLASADLEEEKPEMVQPSADYKYSLDSPTYQEISSQQESVAYDSDAPTNIWESAALESDSNRAYSPMSAVSYHSPEWGGASRSPSPSRSISPPMSSSPSSNPDSSPASDFPDISPQSSSLHLHSPSYNSFSPSDIPSSPPSPRTDTPPSIRPPIKNLISIDPHIHRNPQRRTQHNILILLSRVSYLPDPTSHLITPVVMRSLLEYIAKARRPLSRAKRIVQRLIGFPICFEALVATATPFVIATVLERKEKLLESLLTSLSITMASAYGCGTIAHLLGREDTKTNAAISLPFICRGGDPERQLMETALGILMDLIFRSTATSSFTSATKAVAAMTSHHYNDLTQKSHDLTRFRDDDPKEIEFILDDETSVMVNQSSLLRRSEVFTAMLTGGYAESAQNIVRLRQVPSKPFLALMDLAHSTLTAAIDRYSDETTDELHLSLEMLALSNRYMMTDEHQLLTEHIAQNLITVESVSRILMFALLHNSSSLVYSCLGFAFGNEVTATARVDIVQGWLTAGQSEAVEKVLLGFLQQIMKNQRLSKNLSK